MAEFLGDINLLPLQDVTHTDAGSTARFEGATLHTTPDAGAPTALLAIRPEHMQITSAAPEEGNAIPGQIADMTYMGAETRVSVVTPAGLALTLNAGADRMPNQLQTGSDVWISWSKNRGVFL